MQRLFIVTANCLLLALLLIGLPAATHAQLGNWQITSAAISRELLFSGLVAAMAGNILGALVVAKNRKGKTLYWEWAAVFAGLLLVYWGFTRDYIHFQWLKRALLWSQNHL